MRILALLNVSALLVTTTLSQPTTLPVNRFMDEWEGHVTLNAQAQSICAYMIPLGYGRYEAKCVADFDKGGPYLFRLRGFIRGDQFRFLDDVPFDPGRVLGTTDQGVVFDASFWSGKLGEASAQGTVSGRWKGVFGLKQTRRVSPTLGKRVPAAPMADV